MSTRAPVEPAPLGLQAYMVTWPQRRFLDRQGRAWLYRDNLRTAPALVLLPGALGSGDMAFKLAQGMGDAMRTLSITYPSGVTAACLSKGLAQLLDHLGLGQVAVWGSSYGAWWAQSFALASCERVSALWLGNMPVDGADVASLPLFAQERLARSSDEDVLTDWRTAISSRPESELRDLQLWMLNNGLSGMEFRRRLREVAQAEALAPAGSIESTVIFDCSDDPLLGPLARQRVIDLYPRAKHIHFSEGGHYPHITCSEQLLAALRQWLSL
jgi:maspardin